MLNQITVRLLCALLILPLQACATRYSAEPIAAVIIDTETNQPVEGVVVVAHWQLDGGLEGGSNMGQMMVMEAVTDNTGKFNFPAWGPKEIPGGLPWYEWDARLKDRDPELLLFKSGYRYLRLQNQRTMEQMGRKTPSVRTSDWNGKTIKMEKTTSVKEDFRSFGMLNDDLGFATDNSSPCAWRSLPKTTEIIIRHITLLEEIRRNSAEIKSDRTGAYWVHTLVGRLSGESDAYFISKGCGSPKQFMEALKK